MGCNMVVLQLNICKIHPYTNILYKNKKLKINLPIQDKYFEFISYLKILTSILVFNINSVKYHSYLYLKVCSLLNARKI